MQDYRFQCWCSQNKGIGDKMREEMGRCQDCVYDHTRTFDAGRSICTQCGYVKQHYMQVDRIEQLEKDLAEHEGLQKEFDEFISHSEALLKKKDQQLRNANEKIAELEEQMDFAWGIIANSYGGDWDLAQNKDWKPAAEKWRDKYHELIKPLPMKGDVEK